VTRRRDPSRRVTNEYQPSGGHLPVLVEETIEALAVKASGVYVDATFGRGGHARALLARLGPQGRLIAIDRDPTAVQAGNELGDQRFQIVHARYDALMTVVQACGVREADGVLFDLGVSSPQLDEPARGFSFRVDAPLDMRMDPTQGMSAADWLAVASVDELKEVIQRYGEERFAGQIAKTIDSHRAREPIRTTRQLAELVGSVVRTHEPGKDPATRTFQAIRIYINEELAQLPLGLNQARDVLRPGGRLAVISFHSLEDRIVKNFIRDEAAPPLPRAMVRLPLRAAELPPARMRIVSKPVRPAANESAANPRARSAVLRVAEKLTASVAEIETNDR
jgi:16S rRNA (cytosine1402-N4)-methyltransferase